MIPCFIRLTSFTPLAVAVWRTVPIASIATPAKSTGRMLSFSRPPMIRETSRMSSISFACACAFRSIVCNGVVGHGLDGAVDIGRGFEAMAAVLAPGGLLVIGWNDTDEHRPPDLEPLARSHGLVPTPGAGLDTWRTGPIGAFRHTYDVYRRQTG